MVGGMADLNLIQLERFFPGFGGFVSIPLSLPCLLDLRAFSGLL